MRSINFILTYLLTVQKLLNRSICRLGSGLGWEQKSLCQIGVHWRQTANAIQPSMFGSHVASVKLL